jgi:hypothetical protein
VHVNTNEFHFWQSFHQGERLFCAFSLTANVNFTYDVGARFEITKVDAG